MNKLVRMLNLLIIATLHMTISSCAHQSQSYGISDSDQDGLRFESLSRYNHERLEKIESKSSEVAACHQGRYNKALDSLKQNLDRDKNKPKYWNQIATCYLLKRELPKAKFYYDLALKISGKNKNMKAIIHNNLGLYFNLRELNEEAIYSFNQAIRFNGEFLTPKYNLSKIYLRFGLYKKAESLLSILIKQSPKDISFIASIAHLKLMTGEYKQAKSYFSIIPNEYRTRDSIATNFAMTLFMLGDFKQAKKIISNSDQKDSYYTLTQTKILKKIKYENK
jgi:Tfp pilus assembly protein PilF